MADIPSVVLAEGLPEVADLSDLLPTPCNQGARNTCVGWAGGYALMSYLAAANIEGWNDLSRTDRRFSPTFIFNQKNAFKQGSSSAAC